MLRINFISFLLLTQLAVSAQATTVDSAKHSVVAVHKDSRFDKLADIQFVNNKPKGPSPNPRAAKGYRLMVLSTTDRNQAMRVRSLLLQNFPEQKAYMSYQAPYIKVKFGNFLDKGDAERYRKQILNGKIVTTNVYVVPETIEVKPEKQKETDNEQ